MSIKNKYQFIDHHLVMQFYYVSGTKLSIPILLIIAFM
jgi:hypothetical protein